MISCPNVSKSVIRTHYNVSTLFYRLMWGPHIHHGLWDADESPKVAQVQLTERLADLAKISTGMSMIDIGCGMGGSSIHLAKTRGCQATGVTISRVQRYWAASSAMLQGVGGRAKYRCADAEAVDLPQASADIVWSVECTEHLFDKPAFFRRAAGWLKPGGRMAICAWLAGKNVGTDAQRQRVYDVCEGFFCPSLGATEDYRNWMTDAGLVMEHELDWTSQVTRTWEICRDRVEKTRVKRLARWIDRDQHMFLDRFQTILDAYLTGAMAYGAFVARKPA